MKSLRFLIPALLLGACAPGAGTTNDSGSGDATTQPGTDVVTPPADTVRPPTDVVTPPVDVVRPPTDVVTPPTDVVSPPADVVNITCTGGMTGCGAVCVDTATSAANCGSCGHACTGTQTCTAGACVATTCAGTQMRCSGVCVDTQTEAANCGSCGHACAAGEVCRAGTCAPSCAAPRMNCTVGTMTTCVAIATDPANCGACGHVCTGGTTCVGGTCACPAGQLACSGVCTAVATDNLHCGGCTTVCGAGHSCLGGACQCPTGQTDCSGTCVNLGADATHCGSCTNACVAPATCNTGVCNSLCGSGTTACGGTCVVVGSDRNNCGACGNVCPALTACTAGECHPVNDDRANASPLTLGTTEITVLGTTAAATHDGASPCSCTGGGNVWYSFNVPVAGVVYFDTAGSAQDTSLYFADSTGTPIAAQTDNGYSDAGNCIDDSNCATGGFTLTTETQTAAYLQPGNYYVVVGHCNAAGGFTLHGQYLQRTVGAYFYPTRLRGSGSLTTGLLTNNVTSSPNCGGSGTGEDVRWFTSCGEQTAFFSLCASDGGTYTRRVNDTYFDPRMYIRSALTGAELTCNDDGTSMGATNCAGTVSGPGGSAFSDALNYGSRINGAATSRGLSYEFVDAEGGAASAFMSYTVVYSVP